MSHGPELAARKAWQTAAAAGLVDLLAQCALQCLLLQLCSCSSWSRLCRPVPLQHRQSAVPELHQSRSNRWFLHATTADLSSTGDIAWDICCLQPWEKSIHMWSLLSIIAGRHFKGYLMIDLAEHAHCHWVVLCRKDSFNRAYDRSRLHCYKAVRCSSVTGAQQCGASWQERVPQVCMVALLRCLQTAV